MNKETQETSLFGLMKLKSLVTFTISVLIFIAISWLYFAPNDFSGDVMQQNDVMQGMANGQEAKAFHAETGETTRWTDALFGGMPTFQISPSYDSSSMLSWVGKVYSLQILGFPEYVSWLFMLLLGFFILMLAFDLKWYYAVFGAIGYAFSSYFFIIMGAGHIWKLLVLCYIPPTIAGVVMAYRGKYLTGAAVAALFAALQLQGNHVQMTYYSAFIIVALVIAFLVTAMKERKMKQWAVATGVLSVAAILALAANAPNLYFTQKYAKETMRGGHTELTSAKADKTEPVNGGLSREYITDWSYGLDETFTLLIPNVNGGASIKPERNESDPSQMTNKMMSLDQTSKFNDMWTKGELGPVSQQALGQFTQYFGNQPMTNGPVYVGVLIFVFFLLGCFVVKGPVKWALLFVTILSIFLSWGHNWMWFTDLFIDNFPLYNKFRAVASILVIAEFTMPLLAVLALHRMFTEEDFFKRHQLAIYISFGATALICLFFAFFPSVMSPYSQQEYDALVASGQIAQYPDLQQSIAAIRYWLVSSDAWRSLLVLAMGFSVVLFYKKGMFKGNDMVAVAILAVIVLGDMLLVDKRYIDDKSFISKYDVKENYFTPTKADQTILADTTQNYRVLDVQGFSSPNASYYHKTVGGYHAAKLARYNDLINNQISKNNMQVLNMLNTRWIRANNEQAQLNPEACGNAWFVDSLTYVKTANEEMKFLDKFNAANSAVADAQFKEVLGNAVAKTPGDTIFETTYAPNKLTFHSHSAKGGVAVFSEIYFPWGWKATIDGKDAQIGRVNYVLRAMQIPAGDHTIVMTFDPDEVTQTDGIAKVAIILIFLLVIGAIGFNAWKGQKKEKEEKTV